MLCSPCLNIENVIDHNSNVLSNPQCIVYCNPRLSKIVSSVVWGPGGGVVVNITKSWRLPPVLAQTAFYLSIYLICRKIVANLSVYSLCSTHNSSILSLSSVKLYSLITELQEYCWFNPITNRLGGKSYTR